MNKEGYLNQLRETIQILEARQEYEVCAQAKALIEAIETDNYKGFIDLNFDIKGMKKMGMFPKKATYEEMAEKIRYFFGYKSVYEYAYREGNTCPYYRYANGLHDIIKKVEF